MYDLITLFLPTFMFKRSHEDFFGTTVYDNLSSLWRLLKSSVQTSTQHYQVTIIIKIVEQDCRIKISYISQFTKNIDVPNLNSCQK